MRGRMLAQIRNRNEAGGVISVDYEKLNIDKFTVKILDTFNTNGRKFKEIHLPVNKVFVAKDYSTYECRGSKKGIRGDVAVIELAEDVPFSDMVYPACLNDKDMEDDAPVKLAGYGTGTNVTHKDRDMDELRLINSRMFRCPLTDGAAEDVRCTQSYMAATCGGDSGGGHFYRDSEGRVKIVAPLSAKGRDFNTLVKPNLLWICAATGICLNNEATELYEIYHKKGLTEYWYKAFEKLTGNDVYEFNEV